MSTKKVLLPNDNLHHAYALVGPREILVPALRAELHERFIASDDPDFLFLEYETVSIDDVTFLRTTALQKPIGAENKRYIVVATYALGREAQNALLKSFEEPASGIHFFLIIPSIHSVVPTLRSRLSFISTDFLIDNAQKNSHSTYEEQASAFLAMSIKDRMEWIKDFTDMIKDQKISRHDCSAFLKALQMKIPVDQKTAHIHKDILFALNYAHDPSASFKMLLEHIACVLH